MLLSSCALLSLFLGPAAIKAWPTNSPVAQRSQIEKRACAPSMWTNFDPAETVKKAKLQQAFKDVMIILDGVLNPKDKKNDHFDSVLPKYFPKDNGTKVRETFKAILGSNPDGCGNSNLNLQIEQQHNKQSFSCDQDKDRFSDLNEHVSPPSLVFCNPAFTRPSFSDITCSKIGGKITSDIKSLAAIMFHEILHLSYVGKAALGWSIPERVFVQVNPNRWSQYDYHHGEGFSPEEAKKLNTDFKEGKLKTDYPQQVRPEPMNNPDNYVYFAPETYYSNTCKTNYGSVPSMLGTVKGALTGKNKAS